MKKSELAFFDASTGMRAKQAKSEGKTQQAFDWDKAAEIIKEKLKQFPNLTAEAGLQGDWAYTGGIIFEEGKPTNDSYTYLSSNWAKPTLIISEDGEEILETECYSEAADSRFNDSTKWDEESLKILEINL